METKAQTAKVAPTKNMTRVEMTPAVLREAVAARKTKKEMMEMFEVDGKPVGIYKLRTMMISEGLAKKSTKPSFKDMNVVFEAIKNGANTQKKVSDVTGLDMTKVEACLKIMFADGSVVNSISAAD